MSEAHVPFNDEYTLPTSIYDVPLNNADGTPGFMERFKGKVTLIANCGAGCGNITQHHHLEQLHRAFPDEDFNVAIVVVDDFQMHNLPEFTGGIEDWACEHNNNNKDEQLTPGQVAQKYGEDHFGVTYKFSELTNARYEKDSEYFEVAAQPGLNRNQEPHDFWKLLTQHDDHPINPETGIVQHMPVWLWGADPHVLWHDDEEERFEFKQDHASVERFTKDAEGTVKTIPDADTKLREHYQGEEVPWWGATDGEGGWVPICGHMEKFLVDKTGTKIRRYHNGFLSGHFTGHGQPIEGIDPETGSNYVPRDQNGQVMDHPRATEHLKNLSPDKWEYYKETYIDTLNPDYRPPPEEEVGHTDVSNFGWLTETKEQIIQQGLEDLKKDIASLLD